LRDRPVLSDDLAVAGLEGRSRVAVAGGGGGPLAGASEPALLPVEVIPGEIREGDLGGLAAPPFLTDGRPFGLFDVEQSCERGIHLDLLVIVPQLDFSSSSSDGTTSRPRPQALRPARTTLRRVRSLVVAALSVSLLAGGCGRGADRDAHPHARAGLFDYDRSAPLGFRARGRINHG